MAKGNFPRKGEIWLLRNPERIKEIGKDYRPMLIISNNERNEYDNSVVVLPTTTDDLKNILPVEFLSKILRKQVWMNPARFYAILLLPETKEYALKKD